MYPEQLPTKLQRDPITTAVFEMRVVSSVDGLADLLPGVLYSSLGKRFPRIGNLPFGEIPPQIRATIPDGQYQPTKQMSSPSGLINVNISNRSVVVEALRPYPGWTSFRESIFEVVEALRSSNLVHTVNRYSLRYQNVLSDEVLPDRTGLRATVDLAGYQIERDGFSLRSEIDYKKSRAIVQIVSNTTVAINIQGNLTHLSGTMVDIDILTKNPSSTFLDDFRESVDDLHQMEKEMFFSLISESVLEKLQPVWEK